jgi:hypothetical protein
MFARSLPEPNEHACAAGGCGSAGRVIGPVASWRVLWRFLSGSLLHPGVYYSADCDPASLLQGRMVTPGAQCQIYFHVEERSAGLLLSNATVLSCFSCWDNLYCAKRHQEELLLLCVLLLWLMGTYCHLECCSYGLGVHQAPDQRPESRLWIHQILQCRTKPCLPLHKTACSFLTRQ